ncbi:MAG TPA: oligosaccharide flippase family protein [Candidatus Acidoferrales bacterium]|nr:oligosaccharide flippase family protein [Candidatus Acidoferrales bacterium]
MASKLSSAQKMEAAKTSSEVEELALTTAKRGAIYVIGDVLTSLLTLLMLIILASMLMPSDFGLYSIVIAFSTLLGIGSNFGVGTALRKMLPELKGAGKIRTMLSSGYLISLSIGLIIAILGILFSGYLAVNVYHNAALTLPLQLGSAAELFAVLYNLSLAALVGVGLVKEAAISNTIYSFFSLVFSVGLVLLGFGIMGAILGYLLGMLAGGLVGVAYLVFKGGYGIARPNMADSKKLTSFSMPVVASHVAMNGATNFAVLFLGIFVAASIVGNYGAAYKLARFVELTITDIALILLPAFSRALTKQSTAKKIGAIYNNSLYYTGLLLFPVLAYAISVSKPLINLLFPAYGLAPIYFAIMIAGMGVGLIGTYAGTLILGFGNSKKFMLYQVSAVVIQLILLVVLTPMFKGAGVVLSLFVITPIVLDIIYIRALQSQFSLSHKYRNLVLVSLASLALLGVLYGISFALAQSRLALVVNIAVALVLYPALLALFGAATRKNLEFISKIGKRLSFLGPPLDGFIRYSGIFIKR